MRWKIGSSSSSYTVETIFNWLWHGSRLRWLIDSPNTKNVFLSSRSMSFLLLTLSFPAPRPPQWMSELYERLLLTFRRRCNANNDDRVCCGYQFVYSAIHKSYQFVSFVTRSRFFISSWNVKHFIAESRQRNTHKRTHNRNVFHSIMDRYWKVFFLIQSFFFSVKDCATFELRYAGRRRVFGARTKDQNKRILIDKVIDTTHNERSTVLRWLDGI